MGLSIFKSATVKVEVPIQNVPPDTFFSMLEKEIEKVDWWWEMPKLQERAFFGQIRGKRFWIERNRGWANAMAPILWGELVDKGGHGMVRCVIGLRWSERIGRVLWYAIGFIVLLGSAAYPARILAGAPVPDQVQEMGWWYATIISSIIPFLASMLLIGTYVFERRRQWQARKEPEEMMACIQRLAEGKRSRESL